MPDSLRKERQLALSNCLVCGKPKFDGGDLACFDCSTAPDTYRLTSEPSYLAEADKAAEADLGLEDWEWMEPDPDWF